MKTKRVISALCGVAMLLTGFGLTSTWCVHSCSGWLGLHA